MKDIRVDLGTGFFGSTNQIILDGKIIDTKNIIITPKNLEGALQLGLYPCHYCEGGWGSYSEEKCESCRDTCEYIKKYNEKIKK